MAQRTLHQMQLLLRMQLFDGGKREICMNNRPNIMHASVMTQSMKNMTWVWLWLSAGRLLLSHFRPHLTFSSPSEHSHITSGSHCQRGPNVRRHQNSRCSPLVLFFLLFFLHPTSRIASLLHVSQAFLSSPRVRFAALLSILHFKQTIKHIVTRSYTLALDTFTRITALRHSLTIYP